MDLDPAHLRSFLAIVDYGGYHRAAEALHLTQPAVSRHMRRLESQLAVEADGGRDLLEEVVDRRDADRAEHLLAVGLGEREEARHCSARSCLSIRGR